MPHGLLYEIGLDNDVRQYVIEQDQVLIGRGSDCDIRLRHSTVSRHQALLTTHGGCHIADMGGANATTVNGERLGREPRVLADGDIIKLGACSLRFANPNVAAASDSQTEMTVDLATALFTGTVAPTVLFAPTDVLTADSGADAAVSVVLSKHDEPSLLVREGGRTQVYTLRESPWTIGRGGRCEINLIDPKASREHARLEKTDQGFLLRDLGSANGTLVNGARITDCLLAEDDTVRIGQAKIVLRLGNTPRRRHETHRVMERTPVVLVPGLCGTELFKDTLRVWPNVLRPVSCTEEELADYWGELVPGRVARETVVIPGLVKMEAFGRLVDFMCQELGYTEGVDLLEFGYDWRQDNKATAAILKERVDAWRRGLPDPHAKIVFVAHSMGGLLCRYYLEHLGGHDLCSRLILLGTPNHGSTRIFSTTISGRNALALPIGAARIRKMMMHFPAVYQLLPTYEAIKMDDGKWFAPLLDDGWMPEDCRKNLATAVSFRDALSSTERTSVSTTCVFGYGQRTLVELRVKRERDGTLKVQEEIFDEAGDDAVMEASAVLDRAEIHPVRQRHGALYADKDVQRRLRYELLERLR